MTCGRAVARVGRAKAYVHADQFHQRFNHQPRVQTTPMGYFRHLEPRPWEIDLADLEEAYARA